MQNAARQKARHRSWGNPDAHCAEMSKGPRPSAAILVPALQ